MNKSENHPLNLYKRTIFYTKLIETLNELKKKGSITPSLENKIIAKFEKIMSGAINEFEKNNFKIKGKEIKYNNCDGIWIFNCKDVTLKTRKFLLTFEKLKIIAINENLISK